MTEDSFKLTTIKTNHIECIKTQIDVFTFYLKYLHVSTVQCVHTVFTNEHFFAVYGVESKLRM